MLHFRRIDLDKEKERLVEFRRDSYIVSFGNDAGFVDPDAYVERIRGWIQHLPDAVVFAEYNGEIVGQVELELREFEGRQIGYVHLFYLVPAYRDRGLGADMYHYAKSFFQKHGVEEMHLRVSPSNTRAIRFYEKLGFERVRIEEEPPSGVRWRLAKRLNEEPV